MKRAIWGVAGVIGVVAVSLLAALIAGVGREGENEAVATVAASGDGRPPVAVVASIPAIGVAEATPTTLSPPVSLPAVVTPLPVRTTTSQPPPTTTPVPATVPVTETTTTTAEILAGLVRLPGPGCAPSMFSASVTMSKPSYRGGEAVQATSAFRNVFGQTCYWLSNTGGFDILDPSGASVAIPAVRIADGFEPVPFPAGDALTETWTWDQQVCRGNTPCAPAPPGRYTFVVNNRPYGSGTATFDITA